MNLSGGRSYTIQRLSLDISTDSLYASSDYLVLESNLDQDLVLRNFKISCQGSLVFLWLMIGLANSSTDHADHASLLFKCSQ